MKLFKYTLDIAMDLGTANTIIICNDRIVVDEPSIVAINNTTGKLVALGDKAWQMYGKAHENIKTIRPLCNGVIASFSAAETLIKGLIRMIDKKTRWLTPSLRMVICIPSGSTNVEARAVRESAELAGGGEVYLIHEPMAAAVGIGLDVTAPSGNMIIDIGGGTCEITVIALGGIICSRSLTIAGDVFTSDIQNYIRRQYNIRIGERTAEEIKKRVGAVLIGLESPPENYVVYGSNPMSAAPVEVSVSYHEISHCLDRSISRIETAILQVMELTPPELYADIIRHGIYLTGGGALLRGLDKRLTDRFKIPFKIVDNPLHAVARGTGIVLKNMSEYPFLMS
ncbi:MAG: rod shape-determining protein [Bacteroides sp.]|nr:rod shape-determining protein [Bacteroides sp.]